MKNYPYTIDNGHGELITFVGRINRDGEEIVVVENSVKPGQGPPMHVHHLQDECITVISGTMACEVLGKEPFYITAGQTATFKRGQVHRFWNAGKDQLIGRGEVSPAHNFEYFISEIFNSTKSNTIPRPKNFDAAYLLARYKSEFGMVEIPGFVQKVIFPITVFMGKLAGKHKKFAEAPEPVG